MSDSEKVYYPRTYPIDGDVSQVQRVLNLIMALRNPSPNLPWTKSNIYERVQGYITPKRRTRESLDKLLERDFEKIEDAAFVVKKDNRGMPASSEVAYYIDDPEKIELETDEQRAIYQLTLVWADAVGTVNPRALLGRVINRDAGEDVPSARGEKLPHSRDAMSVALAIADNKRMTCTYRDGKRELEPLRLGLYDNTWYVQAMDVDPDSPDFQQVKSFRLSRMAKIAKTQTDRDHDATEFPDWQFSWGEAKARYVTVDSQGTWQWREYSTEQIRKHVYRLAQQAPQSIAVSPPQVVDGVRECLSQLVDRFGDVTTVEAFGDRAQLKKVAPHYRRTLVDKARQALELSSVIAAAGGQIRLSELAAIDGRRPRKLKEYIINDLMGVYYDQPYPDNSYGICIDDEDDPSDPIVYVDRFNKLLLDDKTLTRLEAVSVLLGVEILGDYLPEHLRTPLESAIYKISVALDLDIGAIFTELSAHHGPARRVDADEPRETGVVDKAEQAIESNRVLTFDYVSKLDKTTSRTVDPLELIFDGTKPQLWAWCHTRQAPRTFYIDRMSHVQVGQTPRSHDSVERPQVEHKTLPALVVALDEDNDWVADVAQADKVSTGQGQPMYALFSFYNKELMVRFLLAYGGKCQKIFCLDDRQVVVDAVDEACHRASKALELYRDEHFMQQWM